ncbi:MAG: (d)CMP kinase [Planctomycetota bacterium]|nr:(d)CMP kinase [Planctomycetota bacterium]
MIVALDGPAGAGKSTVAKLLAEKLGFFYLDTGALFRAVTLAAIEAGANLENEDELESLARSIKVEFDGRRTLLNGKDVSDSIRRESVTERVKFVARFPKVRAVVAEIEKRLASGKNVVVEGRDATTVVFPYADVKFYLDASSPERARRRYEEMKRRGEKVSFEEVMRAIEERDRSDFGRECAPLRASPDAVRVDTTSLSIEEVVERLYKECRRVLRI